MALELRVHGVGGTSAENMLGSEPGAETRVAWRSDPSARSAVRRREGQPGLFAYHWAPLTSGSRWFALWPLLLPFTLANVAGFMTGRATRTRSWVFRAAAVVQGLTLTAVAAWWSWAATSLLVEVVGLPDVVPDGPTWRSLVSLGLGGFALAVVVLVATYSTGGFERYRRRSWTTPRSGAWGASAFTDLRDPQFYDNAEMHKARWNIHVAIAVAAMAIAVLLVAVDGGLDRRPTAVLGWLLLGGIFVAVSSAIVMAATNAESPSRSAAQFRGWRLLGPACVVAAPALLGGLVLSACLWWVSISELPTGVLVVAYPAYGWGFAAMVALTAGLVAWRLMTASPGEHPSGERPALPTALGRVVARVALLPQHLGAIAMTFAGVFLGALVISLVRNRDQLDDYRLTRSAPVSLARWTFALLLAFLFVNLVRSRANPKSLRRVGTLWDVLTFWPRTFHPFAVRCYAERAVPELAELVDPALRREPVVVVAHSQGSVLVYAAVRGVLGDVATAGSAAPASFALVTVGSPLRSLYARAFPRYFPPDDFDDVHGRLRGRWTNLFRFTDYVGRAVFVSDADAASGTAPPHDCWLADPDKAGERVRSHSDYWVDPRVKEVVASFQSAGGMPGGAPDE